jgi:integrase
MFLQCCLLSNYATLCRAARSRARAERGQARRTALDEHKKVKRDENGKPIFEPKYTGMHALRHFFASWCINRKVDGGHELPPKIVQERLGHSTIAMTLDV